MLEVHGLAVAHEEDAEDRPLQRRIGLQDHLILLPVLAGDLQGFLADELVLAHGRGVHQLDAELGGAAVRDAGPDREAVGFPAFHADAEEAFIVQAGPLVRMTGIDEAHIVRAALERAVVPDFHLTEGFPALERVVRELEGTVLHELGVQAAVGRVVDVLEEDAVHRGLDGRADLLEVDVHAVDLREGDRSDKEGRRREKDLFPGHTMVEISFRFSNVRKIT